MLMITVTDQRRDTCQRRGRAVDCLLLTVEGLPGQAGQHTIEIDTDALAHRQATYQVDERAALAAIVKEHTQRLGGLPEHPSHPWGGLRDDIAVTGL